MLPFANLSLVLRPQLRNKIMRIRLPRRPLYLAVRRVQPAQPYVLADRAREESGLLRHERHLSPRPAHVQLLDILAVQPNTPRLRRIVSFQQADSR